MDIVTSIYISKAEHPNTPPTLQRSPPSSRHSSSHSLSQVQPHVSGTYVGVYSFFHWFPIIELFRIEELQRKTNRPAKPSKKNNWGRKSLSQSASCKKFPKLFYSSPPATTASSHGRTMHAHKEDTPSVSLCRCRFPRSTSFLCTTT